MLFLPRAKSIEIPLCASSQTLVAVKLLQRGAYLSFRQSSELSEHIHDHIRSASVISALSMVHHVP